MADLLKPWHDCPRCPRGCGPCGTLHPFNPSGWYGPIDATVFCPACGLGWYGSDAEIEQALIAEWWGAHEDSGLSDDAFLWAMAAHSSGCTKRCFQRGCQSPDRHFGRNAKLCPNPACFNGTRPPCARCRYLLTMTPEPRELPKAKEERANG